MAVTLEAFGMDELSAADKLALAALLQDSADAEADPADDPLTPAQEAELTRRAAYARAHPGEGTPWEVVREAALARSRARQAGQ